jgi:hypothetical protein
MGFCVQSFHFMYAVTAHPLHSAGFSPMTSPYMPFLFIPFFFSSISNIRPPVVVAFGRPLPFYFYFYFYFWGAALLNKLAIQEREGRNENIGEESFEMKVQAEALKWAEGKWTKVAQYMGHGDQDKGGGVNEIVGVKRFKRVKAIHYTSTYCCTAKEEVVYIRNLVIHEWEMIELKKRMGPESKTCTRQLLVSMAISDPDFGFGVDPGRLRGYPLAHLAGTWW